MESSTSCVGIQLNTSVSELQQIVVDSVRKKGSNGYDAKPLRGGLEGIYLAQGRQTKKKEMNERKPSIRDQRERDRHSLE